MRHLILLALLLGSGPSAPALHGHVAVERAGKEVPYDSAFVYLLPRKRLKLTEADAVSAKIVQQSKRFVPAALVVPVGSTVAFPNLDRIEHNVFSPTDPGVAGFDLGRYSTDAAGRTHLFKVPNEYSIYCDIHREMVASIKVVKAPPQWIAHVDKDAFAIADMPADGTYELHAWAPFSEEFVVTITIENGKISADSQKQLDTIKVQLGAAAPHQRVDGSPYTCTYDCK